MKSVTGSAVAMAILLAGCGSKTDANEKNFGAALDHYFDKRGDLCLHLTKWPVEMTGTQLIFDGKKMAALESIGFVRSEDAEMQRTGSDGKPIGRPEKIKRYTLTDAAKPYQRQIEIDKGADKEVVTDLCWGKTQVEQVVKWSGPMQFGEYQQAKVTYKYKIDGLADWAKKPEMQAAVPYMKDIIEGAGSKEKRHMVALTNLGWEAVGYDD